MFYKTQFDPSIKNSYYYVEENMMLGHDQGWVSNKDGGKGNALWRTGFAYITYNSLLLKEGILSCFKEKENKKGKKYIQAYRYPNQGDYDVSRDQITSALVSLKINNDIEDVKRLVKGIRWRISKKFRLSLDMWLWMQSISNKSKFIKNLTSVLFTLSSYIFVLLFFGVWNKILNKIGGVKEVSQEDYNIILKSNLNLISDNDTKYVKYLFKIQYPIYAFHLFAWQLYTTPNNIFKPLLKKLCLLTVHKSNYVLRLLFGDTITQKEINEYRSMSGFRWQTSFLKTKKYNFYNITEILEESNYFNNQLNLTPNYNSLDNDLLWFLAEKHPELIK